MYRIISLSLVGNHRLLNKGTREIHYTPESPLQLILGQNGFGKSTVMAELSPLPGTKDDYIKGGYKHFICEHNTHRFELRSDFTKGAKHSFLKDGQELNLGGTITVQKQLVEAELRYTQDLHQLLIGETKFTELTAQKRKELLVSLCDVDVSYAMRVFASASTNARNVVGAIKHNEQKLVETAAVLLSEEDYQALSAELQTFTAQIAELFSNKELGIKFNQEDSLELQGLQTAIESLSHSILEIGKLPLENATSLEQYQSLVQKAQDAASETQTLLQALAAEYDSLTNLLGQLQYANETKTEDLIQEREALQNSLDKLKVNSALLEIPEPGETGALAMALSSTFDDLCLQVQPNPDLSLYNKETVGQYEAKRDQTQKLLDRVLNQDRLLSEKLQHMKNAERNECPSCHYTWIPGFSEVKVQDIENQLATLGTRKVALEKELSEYLDWLAQAQEWKNHFLTYRSLINTNSKLYWYWDQLQNQKTFFNAPRSLVGTLQRFGLQLLSIKDYNAIKARIALLDESLEKRRLLEQPATASLSSRAIELDHRVSQLTQQLTEQRKVVEQKLTTFEKLKTLLNKQSQLQRLLSEFTRLSLLKARVERNSILDQAIADLQQQSGLLASRLQKATATVEVHKHLLKMSEDLVVDQKAYEILLQELSPTEGLIADSLTGFVNAFVKQLNRIIGRIWKSPLLIHPCAVENGGLNYKFPVQMIASEPREDIAHCSKGEKELINFVFVLVALHYLKLSHLPIYMDEIGGSFSEEHRQSLYDYVKSLVELKVVNQVFIVSHFSTTHGSLKHADVNVIDRTGLLITPDVNKHFIVV